MTRYNIILLLVGMLGSGALGGAANYMLLYEDDPEYAKSSRSFVLALVAAFLSPLFLKTVSSDVIDKITTIRYGSGVPFEFFIFVSFCLLLAVFSRTFAETVAKRLATEVEKAGRESQEAQTRAALAEERASETEPILRQAIEERTEPMPESVRNSNPPALQDIPVDHVDQELLKALLEGQYAYRTVPSLAEETRIDDSDTVKRLERMREHALAGKKTTPTRNLWFVTEKGVNWLDAQATPGESTRGHLAT
jgi:hypothetical protein